MGSLQFKGFIQDSEILTQPLVSRTNSRGTNCWSSSGHLGLMVALCLK